MMLKLYVAVFLSVSNFQYYESAEIICVHENDEFSEMVSECPRTCMNLNPDCNVTINRPSCVCRAGTVNDTFNNRCVIPEHCPTVIHPTSQSITEVVCDRENEVFSWYRSGCMVTCQNRNTLQKCPDAAVLIIATPSCICAPYTVWDNVVGKCTKIGDCPKRSTV